MPIWIIVLLVLLFCPGWIVLLTGSVFGLVALIACAIVAAGVLIRLLMATATHPKGAKNAAIACLIAYAVLDIGIRLVIAVNGSIVFGESAYLTIMLLNLKPFTLYMATYLLLMPRQFQGLDQHKTGAYMQMQEQASSSGFKMGAGFFAAIMIIWRYYESTFGEGIVAISVMFNVLIFGCFFYLVRREWKSVPVKLAQDSWGKYEEWERLGILLLGTACTVDAIRLALSSMLYNTVLYGVVSLVSKVCAVAIWVGLVLVLDTKYPFLHKIFPEKKKSV